MSDRTEELLQGGGKKRSGGGGTGAPFIRWPDQPPAYVEGRITAHFSTQYGDAVEVEVSQASENMRCGDKNDPHLVTVGSQVAVGLQAAALEGAGISQEDIGKTMHFAFRDWVKSGRTGNDYRDFVVIEVEGEGEAPQPAPQPSAGGSDDLPF